MYEQSYAQWLTEQQQGRTGEALRKLSEDHGHAEKLFVQNLWWPIFGNLDHLHAEYEVPHPRKSSYYLDFAYLRNPHKINWEVDDFSSHAKSITRRGFDYERERQNQLMLDSWSIYRFTLDAVQERPLHCRQFILQVMGRLFGSHSATMPSLSLKDREIMRLALQLQRPFTPADVCSQLGVKSQHARSLLSKLVDMQLLVASSGHIRIRTYSLGPKAPSWI